jgi:type I restriction enzyme S subunit
VNAAGQQPGDRCLHRFGDLFERVPPTKVVPVDLPVLSVTIDGVRLRPRPPPPPTRVILAQRGDLVLSRQNLWMGGLGFQGVVDVGVVSQDHAVYRLRSHDSCAHFLHEYLRSPPLIRAYSTVSTAKASGTRRRVDLDALERLLLPLPDPGEQLRASEALQAVDAALRASQAVQEQLTVVLAGLTEELMWNRRWPPTTLGEVAVIRQGFQVPLGEQTHVLGPGAYRYLRVTDYLDPGVPPRFTESAPKHHLLNAEDVVVVRYGYRAGAVLRGLRGIPSNNLTRVRPNPGQLHQGFLFHLLGSPPVQHALRSARTATAISQINHKAIARLRVPFPPREDQREIAERLDAVEHTEHAEAAASRRLQVLKRGLVQRWTPTEPDS